MPANSKNPYPFLFRNPANRAIPFSVIRYFCDRLLGFSGIVYATISSASNTRTTRVRWPETSLWPSALAMADLDKAFLASNSSTRRFVDSGPDSGLDAVPDAVSDAGRDAGRDAGQCRMSTAVKQ